MKWSEVVTVTVSPPQSPVARIDVVTSPPYFIGAVINLDGSQSRSDGVISAYSWNITGPTNRSVEITPLHASNPAFVPDQPGTYIVRLEVIDSYELKNNMERSITVFSPNSGTTQGTSTPSLPSHTTIIIPDDPLPSLGGHLYRAHFQGSTEYASCTSSAIRINDNSSTLSAINEIDTINARVTTRLRFAL